MSLLFKRKPLNTTERFQHSLRTISDEAKGILDSLGQDSQAYTGQIKERLSGIADYAGEASHEIERQIRRNASQLNKVVHNRPYEFLGVAVGVGLLFGLLLSSGSSSQRR
ncbi:Membrane-anchored ribosome-binding protein, inhibits growth in stationary phase, ElaB/YqjD/DUF883 family [Prosthecobacter debontii]|uniref:Membrane-anchored ribosome-binding protein, inhibits growth in stationary phase, ElaB/YqjD/DUF883 family n=1 Tax=Prosthecobacter debontii TaxID=48467 RepID=A0A1T4WIV6_9BACT|nr:DUF883 family protein [Prosthecobacter debontii]SKA77242.1 Membrane-anchored ribosome-binding protein, inhibits growth in stationary phase, ElaB/YqjD/DUF883 family [Prosthecobacter debontii]